MEGRSINGHPLQQYAVGKDDRKRLYGDEAFADGRSMTMPLTNICRFDSLISQLNFNEYLINTINFKTLRKSFTARRHDASHAAHVAHTLF